MRFNRNKNLKIVGFFGQSGAGKTTIIRNVAKEINNQNVIQNTGIIRYLFKKNNNYKNPRAIILEGKKAGGPSIQDIYDKYIRSQIQLLNDWSTEVFLSTLEKRQNPSILLLDRSPIDFYALTLCGIKVLVDKFDEELSQQNKYLIGLNKNIAQDNTNNFFEAIFITKPWSSSNINTLRDGIRDQYLTDEYTEDNWYQSFEHIKLEEDVKTFTIKEDVKDLYKRAEIVGNKLMEI